jgi:hypothetical protein
MERLLSKTLTFIYTVSKFYKLIYGTLPSSPESLASYWVVSTRPRRTVIEARGSV